MKERTTNIVCGLLYAIVIVCIVLQINCYGWRSTGIKEHQDLEKRVEALEGVREDLE